MKNYEITEEQIKQLAKGNAKVKKMFPEVFETKLEVGRWYKHPCGSLINFQGEEKSVYGFSVYHETFINECWEINTSINDWKPATDSEVFEALTNEFKKQNPNIGFNFFRFKDNVLLGWNLTEIAYELFKNGIWTKFHTKEEAEKLLNAKII